MREQLRVEDIDGVRGLVENARSGVRELGRTLVGDDELDGLVVFLFEELFDRRDDRAVVAAGAHPAEDLSQLLDDGLRWVVERRRVQDGLDVGDERVGLVDDELVDGVPGRRLADAARRGGGGW